MKSIANGLTEAKIAAQIRTKLFGRRIKCPRCLRRYTKVIAGRYWCGNCRLKFSLKSCLVFMGSKLPLPKLWQLLECWLGTLSISQAAFVCGLSEPTVRRWYREFSALIPEEKVKLSGTVEIDEAFVGRKKYANQTLVIGALERTTGKISLRPLSARVQGETDRFLLDTVEKYSLVWSIDGERNRST